MLAFVFPGQGSQQQGMLSALATNEAVITDTFGEASEVLGYDLWDIIANGPDERLNDTTCTQPAMLASGVAVWRVWRGHGGPLPNWLAGHSLGEYTALVCAGALAYSDAVMLVAERGRAMQAAVPAGGGAMAAILGLDDDTVRQLCVDAADGDVLRPANLNAPGQVVISGHAPAVRRGIEAARAAGAKRAVELPVSVPSHCPLMEPAAAILAERLKGVPVNVPRIPILHNADVVSHKEPDTIRDALTRQLYEPVRWVETVHRLEAEGVNKAIECGPGRVLSGLGKRISHAIRMLPVDNPETLATALQEAAAEAY